MTIHPGRMDRAKITSDMTTVYRYRELRMTHDRQDEYPLDKFDVFISTERLIMPIDQAQLAFFNLGAILPPINFVVVHTGCNLETYLSFSLYCIVAWQHIPNRKWHCMNEVVSMHADTSMAKRIPRM